MKVALAALFAAPLAAHAGHIGGTALLGAYPGEAANDMLGFVSVKLQAGSGVYEGKVTVTYEIEFRAAAATNCTIGTPCSGGLHVHDGVDVCNDSSPTTTVGGHFYSGSTDPWDSTTVWTSTDGGSTAKGSFDVTTAGLPLSTYADHVVVVHDTEGTRIMCGNILGIPSTAATLGSYPDTTTNVRGQVSVSNTGTAGTIQVAYSLTGLGTDTSGGLHIHAGLTCDDAQLVGGHYWFPETVTDPWSTTWEAAGGQINGWFTIAAGLSVGNADKHAVVVHDTAGARVACGTLSKTNLAFAITDVENVVALGDGYPGYSGANTVHGIVSFEATGDATTLSVGYALWLDGTTFDTPGGLHIHKGVSCDNADMVGGHYWDDALNSTDPWNSNTVWQPPSRDEGGNIVSTLTSGGFNVPYQYPLARNVAHAVVVHDSTGARVACGTISGDYYKSSLARYPCRDSAAADPAEIIGHMVAANTGTNEIAYSYAVKSTETGVDGGLHVHVGQTCPTAGGHYYDATTMASDPWTTKYGATDDSGISFGSFVLDDGYDFAMHRNRATVAHFNAGARAACGTLDGDAASSIGDAVPECPTIAPTAGKMSSAVGVSATFGVVVASFVALVM
jgi:predicted DNA-binding protein with PD1-like motif